MIKFNKILFFSICSLQMLLGANLLNAQNSFRYQAVARDSTGAVIANQSIGLKISIIQVEESLPAVYEETQEAFSNDYGVISIDVGDGTSLLGDFNTLDWSQKSFIKVEIDVTGGSTYDLVSLSEILSVPRALYAETAGSVNQSQFGLNVKDFGAIGNGTVDDTEAFMVALDSAYTCGCKVFVPHGIYRITSTLIIKDGVSLIGEGSGSQPLQTPYNGSLIWYEGNEFAIKIQGHSSRLKDLVLRDKSDGRAAGGVILEAKNRLLESVYLFEVLISGFTNGTALKLSASNRGGIAYASFNNVRVRHALVGIHLRHSKNSFINSNTWNHCQISGGGFSHGIWIEGGNNNIMNGVVVEPPATSSGHIIVEKGELYGSEIRIEGVNQDIEVPLILFAKKTKNSTLTGVYAGGLTLDKGNNFINMKSGKAIHYKNSSFNKFKNATFFSPDNINLPDWSFSGGNYTLEFESPELSDRNNVLKITVAAGAMVKLEPAPLARPKVKELPLFDQVNFGFHIKTDTPGVAFTSTNASLGWTNSAPHSGSDEWEFVGMNAEVNRNSPARFVGLFHNTTGSEVIIYVTTPTLSFGNQLPTLEEEPLFSSGGQLYGMLTHAMSIVTTPNNGFLDLPLNANYFEISNDRNIFRINHQTANRMPRGSVITLLFNDDGIQVVKSAYLNLTSTYTSVENGALSLISNGNGTWREVNRNN